MGQGLVGRSKKVKKIGRHMCTAPKVFYKNEDVAFLIDFVIKSVKNWKFLNSSTSI